MGQHGKTPAVLNDTGFTLLGITRATGSGDTKGIDTGYLSRIFAGKQRPSLKTAQTIAACLGWTIDKLTTELDCIREAREPQSPVTDLGRTP